MAYSDYVQIYNVKSSAGITDDDDRAAQVSKISAWINADFGDIVTASTGNDNGAVYVADKVCRAGFAWGNYNSYTEARYTLYYNGEGYTPCETGTNTRINVFPLDEIVLFVCKTGDGYVMDFIKTTSVGWYNQPRFISFTTDNERVCIMGDILVGSSSGWRWNCVSANQSSRVASNITQDEFFGSKNPLLQKTILSRYTPLNTNAIASTLYEINGSVPNCKTIFEINGNKYLCLNYYDYGTGRGLALKLD